MLSEFKFITELNADSAPPILFNGITNKTFIEKRYSIINIK